MYDNWWQYEKNLDHTHIQNCDFLLMNTLNMTPKVLSALMCGKPIVNSNYLKRILKICQDFISTTDENEKFDFKKPNTKDYMPEITDSSLLKPEYNFGPDPSRVSLFSNKIFIFCDKLQFCKYDPIIRSGSGECQYVDSLSQYQRNITLKATHQQLLLIMMTSDNIQEWVNEIYQDWQIQGKRLIPESEICCAILENSLINYCNSDANTNANLTGYPIEPSLASSIKNIESDNDNNRNTRASEKTKLDPTIKRIRSQLTSSTNDCNNEKLKTNIQADSVEMDEFDWFNVRKMSSNIQSAIGDDDKVAAQISTGLITNESSEANTITNDAKRFAVDDDGWLYTDPSLKSNKTLNIGSSKNVEIVTRKNDRDNLEADTHLKKVVVTRYKKSFDPDPLFCILGREVICDTKVVQTHRHDYNNKDSGNEITGVIIEKESNVASNLKDVTKNINGNGVLTTKKRLNDVEDEDIKVTRIQQKSQSHVKIPKREDPMKFFDFSIKRRINQDSKKLKPS
ncbi:nibrin-like [Gordionus sp. m RMFG-2023]|uniref:nibrin-like n=1 Tax=Gordionus sp. m RMFG-2023 TaxID=3053472 RepID=UPI0031FCEC35